MHFGIPGPLLLAREVLLACHFGVDVLHALGDDGGPTVLCVESFDDIAAVDNVRR